MKNKIISIIFLVIIFSFLLISLFDKNELISYSERRNLASFPKYELTTDYVDKLEKYLLDHFPYRNLFRSIKANVNYYFLQKLENNNIFLKNNYIFKSDYPIDTNSIKNYIDYVNKIKGILSNNNNLYISIIPDKNYYLKDNNFLKIDYDYLYNEIEKLDIDTIDLRNVLNLNDYYQTDTHWKQENLDKVIKKISEKLNFEYKEIIYDKKIYDKFYGVFYGESAINRNPEKLVYLTNEIIDNAKVYYLENDKLDEVYNEKKLSLLDSYDVFLDGASSYIVIENDLATNDKELVIFRDSFGSSIAPLLIPYYKKITLIDNRYISSQYLSDMITFDKQDIIILNSTLLVNKSNTLKK